jgi:hypothetical protein
MTEMFSEDPKPQSQKLPGETAPGQEMVPSVNQSSVSVHTAAITDGLAAFQVAKERATLLEKIRDAALKCTKPRHWTDQGGHPFLNSRGTDHVERAFGIKSTIKSRDKEVVEDELGKYYIYTFIVESILPAGGDSCEAIGMATSRDQFLGTGTKENQKKKLYEVNEPNISKKAWTDARRTGIQRLLDLRGLEWEELESITGISRSDCQQVTYKKGGRG